MSDSVDRVFVHALNTVKKIPRTGTARPPASERLKLFGLYKQSMEGDVEGIMDRPIGDAPDVQAEREKWDAWYSQRGLSRTEAKGRYITTLINTMHLYASQTAEARELVAELEFVWDQIKYNNNASSSSSSSLVQTTSPLPIVSDVPAARRYGSINDRMARSPPDEEQDEDLAIYRRRSHNSRLRVLSPVSQPEEAEVVVSNSHHTDNEEIEENNEEDEEAEEDGEDEEDEDEFQEARDGTSYSEETTTSQDHTSDRNNNMNSKRKKRKGLLPSEPRDASRNGPSNDDWRQRVEQALTKMTVEIAALREQIESRPSTHTRRRSSSMWSWLKWLTWNIARQAVWQCSILAAVLIWMRLRGDRRLEERLRKMLGDLKKRFPVRVRLPRRPFAGLPQISLP